MNWSNNIASSKTPTFDIKNLVLAFKMLLLSILNTFIQTVFAHTLIINKSRRPWITSKLEDWSSTTAAIFRTFLAPVSVDASKTTQSLHSNAFCGMLAPLFDCKHFSRPGSSEVLQTSNSRVLGFESCTHSCRSTG